MGRAFGRPQPPARGSSTDSATENPESAGALSFLLEGGIRSGPRRLWPGPSCRPRIQGTSFPPGRNPILISRLPAGPCKPASKGRDPLPHHAPPVEPAAPRRAPITISGGWPRESNPTSLAFPHADVRARKPPTSASESEATRSALRNGRQKPAPDFGGRCLPRPAA